MGLILLNEQNNLFRHANYLKTRKLCVFDAELKVSALDLVRARERTKK